jgi:uncharacterized metal-binding protein YceD (DUF177 family)
MTAGNQELSHPVRLDRVGGAALTVSLRPDAAARAALAERFALLAVDAFTAELTVRRRPEGGWIEVAGLVTAAVVQTCVVTMEPVAATVEAEVVELFDDSGEIDAAEIDLDPMAETPEPVSGDSLDIGEIAAQSFGLALDPYPRAADAGPVEISTDAVGSDGGSPFAKLAALQGRTVKKE